MSKKPQAMPLFADAYMADTMHLTLEEHGAYLRLLMLAWRTEDCTLPNDDKRLCRMLGINGPKWKKLKPVVMDFWTLDGDRWNQKRLKKERFYVENKCKKNAENIKGRWSQVTEKAQSGAYDGGYQIDTPPPPPLIEAKASIENDPEVEFGLVADAARLAGISSPNQGTIVQQSLLIRKWVKAGASADLIRQTIAGIMAKGITPRTLAYFTPAIEDAITSTLPKAKMDASAEMILKRLKVGA